jgi:hypothetical protein
LTRRFDVDALAAEFKGGEIDFEQYRVQADALNKSERALNEIRLKASLSQEMTAQTQEQEWAHTVQKFLAATSRRCKTAWWMGSAPWCCARRSIR